MGENPVATFVGTVAPILGGIFFPVKLVLDVLAALAMAVLDLLPDTEDLGLDSGSGWIRGYDLLNTFLPVSEALSIVSIVLVVVVAGTLWRLAVTVYHLIPKPLVGT